jgi:hypothetical protein
MEISYRFINDQHGNPCGVCRLSDMAAIPFDPANTDYQQYLAWLEEGNEPLSVDPEPTPEPLTAQQKLEAAGLTVEELKELLGL